jgi:general secretion pathway protein I
VKQTAGFTLREMIVATLIMGIAVVGTLAGISGSLRNASRLMEHDRAVLMARSKMNELLADRKLPRDRVVGGSIDATHGWRARASIFDKHPHATPGTWAIERVELEVWWMAGNDRRTFTLEGYQSVILTAEDMPPVGAPGP